MDRLAAARSRGFEDRMIEHLRRFCPRHIAVLGDDQVRIALADGMARARRSGFTSERSIRYYVEMMFMLGSGFEADRLFPWVGEIFAEGLNDQNLRIDRLYARAWAYLRQILPELHDLQAERGARLVGELDRIRREPDRALAHATGLAGADLQDRILRGLQAVLPRKLATVGEVSARAAIERALDFAARLGVGTERGALVLVDIHFMMNGCFEGDMLLPWLSPILGARAPIDPLITAAVEHVQAFWR